MIAPVTLHHTQNLPPSGETKDKEEHERFCRTSLGMHNKKKNAAVWCQIDAVITDKG